MPTSVVSVIGWRTRRTGVRAKPDGFNPTKFTCPIVYSFASGGGDHPVHEIEPGQPGKAVHSPVDSFDHG
jgi:hypothetical protein